MHNDLYLTYKSEDNSTNNWRFAHIVYLLDIKMLHACYGKWDRIFYLLQKLLPHIMLMRKVPCIPRYELISLNVVLLFSDLDLIIFTIVMFFSVWSKLLYSLQWGSPPFLSRPSVLLGWSSLTGMQDWATSIVVRSVTLVLPQELQ